MQYRVSPKTKEKISLLGLGAMRLKSSNGGIDLEQATQQIKYAVDNGINFIDTAYLYGNGSGSNEKAVGEVLQKLGYRDKVKISTKMNRLKIKSRDDMDKMFNEELENLKTDYIDYYFIHNIISYTDLTKLIDIGLLDFIKEKKERGQIKNIGFSFHGSLDDFKKVIELYDWDATILQYNYFDKETQAGLEGIKLANEHDMAVIIMEPLKGGLLARTMPKEIQVKINQTTNRTNADLALSWIYDTLEITSVLSGMNTIEMIKENIDITNNHENNPLNNEEQNLINDITTTLQEKNKINCTSCNYCMPCPVDINIPYIFRVYNEKHLFPEEKSFGVNQALLRYTTNILGLAGKQRDPSLCINCNKCTEKCPQQLEIPELIKTVDKSFHGGLMRKAMPVIRWVMNRML